MKPWREIAIPHSDVLKGTFQQAEFAADITAVRKGTAPAIYQDGRAFFERTFITEGMRLLITQVVQRLAGRGGDPIIQLQTAFGGGKTHSLLAIWHIVKRQYPLSELQGIPSLVEQAGLMDIPQTRVAVIEGNAHSPGQPWKEDGTVIRTLWGELAWQLGGAEGYAQVADADVSGTSPGKDLLQQVIGQNAPCVILLDELVAYIRQFPEDMVLSGGTYDSNISFIQALTEAVKTIPTAVILASLPESEIEAGSARGVGTLRALEKTFGRVQALWKPVAAEESFAIVRRRLFEPIRDEAERNRVCRAFADAYLAEGTKVPGECQEARYLERLCLAYPIHPECFDRLYQDWSTIDGFQRTRGVLKLLAKVIHRLWKDGNTDLMILPASLPLADSDVRNEMTYLLPPGWDPVIERDIDGDRAETTAIEAREPRFGQVGACRRVARTLFLGSAPASVGTREGNRGLDRSRVLLGCLQPGQAAAVYSDALNRLADRLHYLNANGERANDTTRFWFDTRANLRREMEERKRRFEEKGEIRKSIEHTAKQLFNGTTLFDGVHVFTASADVPDDEALRLVLLPPERAYIKEMPRQAEDAVREYLQRHGVQPRHRANRLLFVAPDNTIMNRMIDATRTTLAWKSIVEDVEQGRLNIDQMQKKQAVKEADAAAAALPRMARECFKWLLCPVQDDPKATKADIEVFALNPSGASAARELDRVCRENELVIETWSPIHLRTCLRELYWKEDRPWIQAMQFWKDTLCYLYLPRLRARPVLDAVIRKGSESRDFFGTAYGVHEGRFEGFQVGQGGISLDDTLLLIDPEVAARYDADLRQSERLKTAPGMDEGYRQAGTLKGDATGKVQENEQEKSPNHPSDHGPQGSTPRAFHGSVSVNAVMAKSRLNTIAEEIIALLAADPKATLQINVEIHAEFAEGVRESIRRSVTENANQLGFSVKEWE